MRKSPARSRLSALLLASLASLSTFALAKDHGGLSVTVQGEGRPVLMIPGLNSSAQTWTDTCQALQADGVQCHLVQLPGFAGLPPRPQVVAGEEPFLPTMRDLLLAYIEREQLEQPAVVGHSLGGMLTLMMAMERPDALGPLVIVDSLPFFPAAMNPQATEESSRPMADAMREGMRSQDDETYVRNARTQAGMGMSRDPQRTELVRDWTEASDRATTTQAMYELFTTDLRPQLGSVRNPVLVLGAWAAFEPMGSTLDSTRAIFERQYQGLDGVRIEMSEQGYHFLMFDDPSWLQAQIRAHLAPSAAAD